MKIRKRNISKKAIVIGIFLIIILVSGAFFAYLYQFHGSLFSWQPFPKEYPSSIDYDEATNDQKKAGNTSKQKTANQQDPSKPSTGSDQPPDPVPQPDGRGKVDIIITASNQNGSVFQIRSDILAVTNSGTCTITLTKGAQTVTKTAGVQALSSSSTCQGFDIPIAELSPGLWQLSLHFENSNLTADTTKTITIQ